ncbi:MAG: response regulator [Desulfobacterales bacterium]|nr:response regulator [Desulfobacterales bacterium]
MDDIPSNIDILVEILGEDYDVRVALDGLSALEDVAEDPPDLILLDIMMPDMDGYEVCGHLKSDPATRDIPVIFVTAKGEVGDEVRGFDSGAVDYITKPVSAPVVQARVATHLALRQANRILAERNKALEENIRLREDVEQISRHDLKTPLNKIVSLPRLMMGDDSMPVSHHGSLRTIERAGLTMLDMINHSLDLVKMERGTYGFEPESVNVSRVVERVVADLLHAAEEKGCRLQIDNGGEDLRISGEALLCYSLVANLVRNAVEASPENEVIRISVCLMEKGFSALTVKNRGDVPEAIRECFFEKYATAGKKGGTGLGTYSARLMARTMGGDVTMSTGPDEGTEIRVTLPVAGDDLLAGALPESPVEPGRPDAEIHLPDLKVLIADDDPDNLSILAAFLTHPALAVDRAENGRSAVELWRRIGHDLIFMDLEMPVMDGMAAVREIREDESRQTERAPYTGVFALSSHDEAMAERCMDAGFDGYLTKPVSKEELFRTMIAWGEKEDASETERVEIDKDLEDIIPVFLENKAGQIRELESCIKVDDRDGIRRTAHKLKGGFNMYGFSALGSVCADLETTAVEGRTEKIRRLGDEVARRFEQTKIVYR